MEAHLGQPRIAQSLLPELRRCRALRPDPQAVAGQVLRDAPPSADSLSGERSGFLAQDGTIAPTSAAAEHHVGDDQAAARPQPARRTRGQRPLVGIGQVVQRVAADDQVGVGRRKPEILQVSHLGRYVRQPRIGCPLGQGVGHRGRDIDCEHRGHQRCQGGRDEPGAGAEIHADIGPPRLGQNENAVKHLSECFRRSHVIMPLLDALIPLLAYRHY
jgi:hypothetical protein